MDNWTLEQAYIMANVGNKIANEFWEYKLPVDFQRPVPTNKMELALFIKRKYEQKLYAFSGIPPHITALQKKIAPKQKTRHASRKRASSPTNSGPSMQPSTSSFLDQPQPEITTVNMPARSGSQIIFVTGQDDSSSDSLKENQEVSVESIMAENIIKYVVAQILEPDVEHTFNLLNNIEKEQNKQNKEDEILMDVDDDFFEDHPPKFVDEPKIVVTEPQIVEEVAPKKLSDIVLDVDDNFFDIDSQKPKFAEYPVKKVPNPAKAVPVIEKPPKKLPRPGVIIMSMTEKKKKKHHKKKSTHETEKAEEPKVETPPPQQQEEQAETHNSDEIDDFFDEFEKETKKQPPKKPTIEDFFHEDPKPAKPVKIPTPFIPATSHKGPGTQLPARLQKRIKSREKVVVGERKRK